MYEIMPHNLTFWPSYFHDSYSALVYIVIFQSYWTFARFIIQSSSVSITLSLDGKADCTMYIPLSQFVALTYSTCLYMNKPLLIGQAWASLTLSRSMNTLWFCLLRPAPLMIIICLLYFSVSRHWLRCLYSGAWGPWSALAKRG